MFSYFFTSSYYALMYIFTYDISHPYICISLIPYIWGKCKQKSLYQQIVMFSNYNNTQLTLQHQHNNYVFTLVQKVNVTEC